MNLRAAGLLIVFSFTFLLPAWSQESGAAGIPEDVQDKALVFLRALANGDPEEIHSHFDLELKNEVGIEELGAILAELEGKLGDIDTFEFVASGNIDDVRGVYPLGYKVTSGDRTYSYRVLIERSGDVVAVRAFNLDSIPASRGPGQSLTMLRIAMATFFILCILIQLWCVIHFARTIASKPKKWVYICLSLLGFPFGFSLGWITGTIGVNFGFIIPAVTAAWPLDGSGHWTMSVYFPFGLALLIVEGWRGRRHGRPDRPPEGVDPA